MTDIGSEMEPMCRSVRILRRAKISILRVEVGWVSLRPAMHTVSNEEREEHETTVVQGENLVPLRDAAPASDLRLFPLLAHCHDTIEFSVSFSSKMDALDLG